jgi:hypothetical protein
MLKTQTLSVYVCACARVCVCERSDLCIQLILYIVNTRLVLMCMVWITFFKMYYKYVHACNFKMLKKVMQPYIMHIHIHVHI